MALKRIPRPRRTRPQNVSRWYIPWRELKEVQAAIEGADASNFGPREGMTLQQAREAYQESREEERENE